MRSHVLTASRLLSQGLQRGGCRYRAVMVTLTYAQVGAWAPRHVSEFLKLVREYLRRRGWPLRYVWVHELQKRGVPHYHVLLFLPRGVTLPKPDKQGWWPHGMTRIEWVKRAVGYLAKYTSKGSELDRFPKGARICGSGGLEPAMIRERRWWRLPGRVREVTVPDDDVVRNPGGGFVSRVTGERWFPLWRFAGFVRAGGVSFVKFLRVNADGIHQPGGAACGA